MTSEAQSVATRIAQADKLARAGDANGAANLYENALQTASEAQRRGAILSSSLAGELRRVSTWLQGHMRERAGFLDEALDQGGFGPGRRSELIDETLAILRGEAPVQLQRPSKLYVPGLPQRAFYERDEFEWVEAFEAQLPQIRAEIDRLLDDGDGGFTPYIEAGSDRSGGTAPNAHLAGDPRWGAYHLLRKGEAVDDHAAACPATMAALALVPLPRIAGSAPMALFSLLRPGAHIRPHHGLFNFRLICHLPLVVPPDCAFRVGNRTRSWREGKLLIFDDSIEHEAWNGASRIRAILLFEIWRPEIGAADREALSLLIEAAQLPSED